jgi:hypothetical protein
VSEPYTPDNLLDRRTSPETLAAAYEAEQARERERGRDERDDEDAGPG